ncbi:MAG: hypothetical protein K8R90_03780 [Candidatus Cloacimonetes bacterium]|nr:hypothetical protein [Candidatus Cloacimonadota bacterium]
MNSNLRYALFIVAVVVFSRFIIRLLFSVGTKLYALVPMYFHAWYISIPLTILIIMLVRTEFSRRRRGRKIDGLNPEDEIDADVEIEDEDDTHEEPPSS